MAYSKDLREHVKKIKEEEGLTYKEVAARFKLSLSSLVRWKNKTEPQKTRSKPATRIDMDVLKGDIEKYPDAYQYERAQRLNVSRTCVECALKRLKVTYKKNSESSKSRSRKTICLLPTHSNL